MAWPTPPRLDHAGADSRSTFLSCAGVTAQEWWWQPPQQGSQLTAASFAAAKSVLHRSGRTRETRQRGALPSCASLGIGVSSFQHTRPGRRCGNPRPMRLRGPPAVGRPLRVVP